MSNSEISGAAPKLKIWALVKGTYGTIFKNFGGLFEAVWLLACLNLAYAIYQVTLSPDDALNVFASILIDPNTLAQPDVILFVVLIVIIVSLLILYLFGGVIVSIQRFVLLGERPAFFGFRLGKRELRTFGYLLALITLGFLLSLVMMFAMVLLQTLLAQITRNLGAMGGVLHFALLLGIYAFAIMISIRIWFVLPAIAFDQKGGLWRRLSAAWRSIRGNTFRMFIALFITQLPIITVYLVTMAIFMATGFLSMQKAVGGGGDPDMTALQPVFEIMGAINIVMVIAFWLGMLLLWVTFAIAYKTLAAHDVGTPPEPTEA